MEQTTKCWRNLTDQAAYVGMDIKGMIPYREGSFIHDGGEKNLYVRLQR